MLVLALALGARAELAGAQPGFDEPAPAVDGLAPLSDVLVLETPPVDVAVAAARAASETAGGPFRFAEPFAVDVTTLSHGRWETTTDGRTAVWRLRVVSSGAVSLNFGFGRYRMPSGGRLRVYTPGGDEVLGPFTDADNRPHGELWTPILSGGDVVIEVAVPVERIGELELRLDAVNRGFRDLVAVPSPSHGWCNVDVACPAGDPYRDQIRSVGVYTRYGRWRCSGVLVNNTAADSRMFLLTAEHCISNASAAASVVMYWNYQRPACGLGTASARGSQRGAALRASYGDMVVLELNGEPDPADAVYLAGWDRSAAAPTSVVAIHQPRVHYKSISVDNGPLTRTDYLEDAPRNEGDHWRVGTLEGGVAACGNDEPDWFMALAAVPWGAEEGNSGSRFSDWLDPAGTGATSLDGMNPNHRPSILHALDDKAVKAPGEGESAEALSVDLSPFFRDADGDALTYAATSSDETAVTASVSGSTVSLTPVAAGSSTITVIVTDAGGSNKEATQTFRVTAGANRSPAPSGGFADQSLNEGGTAQFDLTNAFTEGDGETLTLASSSTDTSVATVALSGSTVTVTAVDGPGTATIDVTATDAGGSNTKARHRFDVTVLNEPPEPVGSLAARVLQVGDGNQRVGIASAFSDAENEALTYRSSSSARDVVRSTISGSTVTLIPVSRGNATMTVTATDLGGSVRTATQTFDVRVKGRRGVSVSTGSLTVVEGATATYTVVLDSEPTGEVTVTPTVVSSTKITVSPSSLTFDATDWETAQTVTVEGVHDADWAHEASVTVRHAVSGADYGSVTAASLSVEVHDDDGPPVMSVAAASSPESGGSLTFDVALGFAATLEVEVDYATSDGSGAAGARAGTDYTAASGTLTFPVGTTGQQIVVDVTDDDEDEEEEETFRLTLSNPRNATLSGGGSTLQAAGTIEDDDDPRVRVSFGASSYGVTEGRSVSVAVRLDRDPERDVEIFLDRTHHGGAEDADYSGVPDSVVFGSGAGTRSFLVTATEDGNDDDGEAVVLSFAYLPSRVSGDGETTIAIHDNDGSSPPGGGDVGPPGGGGGPPGGGGGDPPPEDDEDDPDDEPPPPPPPAVVPPTAAISLGDGVCDGELCRALTGEALRFTDTSAGTVRFRSWDFGDGRASRAGAPVHSWSSPGFYEVTLTVSNGAEESTASLKFLVEAAEPAGPCAADAETRCLLDSRYAVTVKWLGADGEVGGGVVVHEGTNESALFRFFDVANWEVLIKLLDGCAANGHVWVFGASSTDLGYVIRVTDTVTETVREYRNVPGMPAAAVTDSTAFPDGCGGLRIP